VQHVENHRLIEDNYVLFAEQNYSQLLRQHLEDNAQRSKDMLGGTELVP
jgi:hypothetical protein